MTRPGGNDEVASLLLRVGVDFQALEDFVSTLPAIPAVLEEVGARINAAQIGSAPIFREKGAALATAMAAGFQAEALGLNFGDIGTQITRSVFGQLDVGQIDRYRDHVRELYAVIRNEVPEVTRPLIDTSALQGLAQITGGAGGARSAVEGLTAQLGVLRAELGALQGLTLPKTLVRQTSEGVQYTQAAQRALAPLGQTFPQGLPQPQVISRDPDFRNINMAATNRETQSMLRRELESSRAFIERSAVPNTQQVLQAVTQAPRELFSTAAMQRSTERQAASLDRASASAERFARVVDKATDNAMFSRGEVALQARQTRGQVDVFEAVKEVEAADNARRQRQVEARARRQVEAERLIPLYRGEKTGGVEGFGAQAYGNDTYLSDRRFFAADPVTALQYAGLPLGPEGRLLQTMVPQRVLDGIGGRGAGEYPLPKSFADDARVLFQGTNAMLGRISSVLTGDYSGRAALPAGVGLDDAYAENARRQANARTGRAAVRLAEIAERRQLELVDTMGEGFRGTGMTLGAGVIPSTLTGQRQTVSQREISTFQREANESILRGLAAQVNADQNRGGFTGFLAAPENLRGTLGRSAYDDMVAGKGLGRGQTARLQPEALALLSSMSADGPLSADLPARGSRLFPPGLLTREAARREFLDPNRLDPLGLPFNGALSSQLAITAGTPFDSRLAPANVRSQADDLAAGARARALAAGGDLSRFARQIPIEAVPGAAGGDRFGADIAPPFRQVADAAGAAASALRAAAASARDLARAEARDAAIRAAGGDPAKFLAQAPGIALTAPSKAALPPTARFALGAGGAVDASAPISDPGGRLPVTADPTGYLRRQREQQRVNERQERLRRAASYAPFDQSGFAGGPAAAGGGRGGFAGGPPLSGEIFGPGDDGYNPRPGGPVPPRQGRFMRFASRFGPTGESVAGGLREGFLGGEDGDSARFFSRSVASAARFSLVYAAAYGGLRLFTTAFSEGVRGAIEFEQALTDLNIVTERTGRSNESFAFSLADVGAGRGFAPGDSVAAGARAIGLFDKVDSGRQEQEAVARESLDVATKIAFISGQPLEQVQTQIAGISRSFGIDPLEQERIADVASYIGRRTGRPGGEVLQSLGQIGSLGESAGFDLEQVGAIIARLTSTTGQTPQAVSGFLSQVLSRADDPRLQQKLRSVGVQTEGTTLAQQVEQLSGLNLPDERRNQIIQGFGRGRSGQALGIILDQFPDIQRLAEGAKNDSEGLAERDFDQAVNTVGSQVRVLGSSIKDLATGIVSTGVFDILVALLSVTQQVVEAVDFVVDAFNLIPRELRTAAAAVGTFVGALALLSRYGPLAGAGGALATFGGYSGFGGDGGERPGAVRRVGGILSNAFAIGVDPLYADVNRESAGRAARGARGGLRSLLFNPVIPGVAATATTTGVAGSLGGTAATAAAGGGLTTLATGGAIAAGVLLAIGIIDAVAESGRVDKAIGKAGATLATANTDEEFGAAIRDADAAIKKAKQRDDFDLTSKDSFTLGLSTLYANVFGGSNEDMAEAKELKKLAEERRDAAKVVQESDKAGVFGSFDPDSIAMGMSELAERGLTATQRLTLLNQAFDGLITKSTLSSGAIGVLFQGQGERFSRAVATATLGAGLNQAGALRDEAASADPFSGGFLTDIPAFGDKFNPARLFGKDMAAESRGLREEAARFESALGDPELQDKLSAAAVESLKKQGKDPASGSVSLNAADVKAVEEGQLEVLKGVFGDDLGGIPAEIRDIYLATLPANIRAAFGDFNGVAIDSTNVRAYLDSVMKDAPAVGREKGLTSGSDAQGAEATLSTLRAARGRVLADAATETNPQARADMMEQLGVFNVEILAAQKAAGAAARAEAESFVEVQKARLKNGDVLGTVALDLSSNTAALRTPGLTVVERNALLAERANLSKQQAAENLAISNQNALNAINPSNTYGRLGAELGNARRTLGTLAPQSAEAARVRGTILELRERAASYVAQYSQALSLLGSNPANAERQSVLQEDVAFAAYDEARRVGDPLEIARTGRAAELSSFARRDQQINTVNARNSFQNFTDPGSGIQSAADELSRARMDIQRFDVDSAEWFDAQRRVREAMTAVGDSYRSLGQTRRRLGSDLTNPLEQARLDLQDTTDELAAARARGAGPDTIAALELEQRQGSNTLERTAFDQRMNDFRTRNQLGELTDSAYVEFLNSEKARLEAIQNKSFQQQQFLNEVNQALLGLNDQLQGQFNLGDIDVPAPFEARRLLGTPGGGGAQTITSIDITVNGGNINEVRGVMAEYLGPVALSRTPTVTPTRV